MLAVVLLPSEAWGATSGSSVSGWLVVGSPASAGVSHTLNSVTFDNDGRGLASISVTRNGTTTNAIQVYAYCATAAAATPSTWTPSGVTGTSGWSQLSGDIYTATAVATVTSTDAAPGFARSNFMTNLCPAGSTVKAIRSNLWSGSAYEDSWWYGGGPAAPSTCPDSFVSPRLAFEGTTLRVRFGWVGSAPSGGWKLHLPGDGYTGSGDAVTLTVPRVKVAGTNDYGADLAGATVVTVGTSFRLSSAASFGCYALGTVAASLDERIVSPGVDPDSGEECSTLDLFCQLRSAFTPSQSSLDQWTELGDDLGDVVPFGYVSDSLEAFAFLGDTCTGFECDNERLSGMCFQTGFTADAVSVQACPFGDNAVTDWLADNRAWLSTLAWIAVLAPLVGFVWRKSVPFVNGGS
jgi:hypothetical protein